MTKQIKITGETIQEEGAQSSFTIDGLFSDVFFKYADEKVVDYNNSSYYVNELYINFVQPFLALEHYISTLSKEAAVNIDAKLGSVRTQSFVDDIQRQNSNLSAKLRFGYVRIKLWFVNHILLLASMLYLFYRMILVNKSKTPARSESLYLVRSKSSIQKFETLNVPFEVESFEDTNQSVYSYYGFTTRISWVFLAWFEAYREWNTIRKLLTTYLGKSTASLAFSFYSKRLVHTILYEKVLDHLLVDLEVNQFYTGNNLDRFSVIEEQLCIKHSISLICMPHGLEYGFKFPKGFSGDTFFTTSNYAADYLNKLYDESKFVFDKQIARSIFSVKKNDQIAKLERKVMFFTEPREAEVNHLIIKELLPKLKAMGIKLFLKLHPKDISKNYKLYDVNIEESLDAALCGNICFARKSTTLLEATYNNSAAAAILINEKDKAIFNTFPSLQDSRIKQYFDVDSLCNWIQGEFEVKS